MWRERTFLTLREFTAGRPRVNNKWLFSRHFYGTAGVQMGCELPIGVLKGVHRPVQVAGRRIPDTVPIQVERREIPTQIIALSVQSVMEHNVDGGIENARTQLYENEVSVFCLRPPPPTSCSPLSRKSKVVPTPR